MCSKPISLTRTINHRGRDLTPISVEDGRRYLIPLPKDMFALIDAVDLPKIQGISWGVHKGHRSRWYARAYVGRDVINKDIFVYMHRLIADATDEGGTVDHIRREETLNNTRANLRIVDKGLQSHNARLRADNTTGFKGVYLDRRAGSYYSQFVYLGKTIHCGGGFKYSSEAARARDRKAIELLGLDSGVFLNFPVSDYTSPQSVVQLTGCESIEQTR